jgi:aryl-alcohol dehydrogenase-like predicted oxidoreductase
MFGGQELSETETKYSEVLSKVAEEHGLESVTTIALAYVMSKVPYIFPIVGGRKVEVCWDPEVLGCA